MTETATESSRAPAVTRAVRILGVLADARGVPVSLSDLARELGAAKSSVLNICVELETAELVQRRESGYTLGRRTVELGGAYLASFDQVREFYRVCSDSNVLSHELVQIAVLDGTDVIYLARHEGRAPLRLTAGVGDRYPASATAVGNALLAALDPDEVRRRYEGVNLLPVFTRRSPRTLTDLGTRLEATRRRGYALDQGGVFPNVVGMALTVPALHDGERMFALGVSTISAEEDPVLAESREHEIVEALRVAAGRLSNPMVSFDPR